MTINEILSAFRVARQEAEGMLVRDGVSADEAATDAASYVSMPTVRRLSEAAIVLVEATLGMRLPQDLRSLIAALDLSTAKIWDADFRPMNGDCIDGISDAFLASVAGWTASLHRVGSAIDGLAFGTTQDGDYWVLRRDGASGTPVCICDHAGMVLASCASDFGAFLLSSARAAASYYRRFGRVDDEEDWAASVLEEALMDGVDAGWLELSIRSRPRPI